MDITVDVGKVPLEWHHWHSSRLSLHIPRPSCCCNAAWGASLHNTKLGGRFLGVQKLVIPQTLVWYRTEVTRLALDLPSSQSVNIMITITKVPTLTQS